MLCKKCRINNGWLKQTLGWGPDDTNLGEQTSTELVVTSDIVLFDF